MVSQNWSVCLQHCVRTQCAWWWDVFTASCCSNDVCLQGMARLQSAQRCALWLQTAHLRASHPRFGFFLHSMSSVWKLCSITGQQQDESAVRRRAETNSFVDTQTARVWTEGQWDVSLGMSHRQHTLVSMYKLANLGNIHPSNMQQHSLLLLCTSCLAHMTFSELCIFARM